MVAIAPKGVTPVLGTGAVRLCTYQVRSVQVRLVGGHTYEVEGNCVIARWGGEQPEANEQPVG